MNNSHSNKPFIGLDGYQRIKETDKQISLNVAHVFQTDSGKEVLKYLRSITIELVHGSNVTNEELRHVEGQRYLVGLIESRINHAHKVKNNE
jgi:hypothetical protein